MKKICPYCHEGKLTVKNTYDFDGLLSAYPHILRKIEEYRPDVNFRICSYKRSYCDKCEEYVWSYEEVFHKVPKRQMGIHNPRKPQQLDDISQIFYNHDMEEMKKLKKDIDDFRESLPKLSDKEKMDIIDYLRHL